MRIEDLVARDTRPSHRHIADQRHRKPVKNPLPAHIPEINRSTDPLQRCAGDGQQDGNLAVVRQAG